MNMRSALWTQVFDIVLHQNKDIQSLAKLDALLEKEYAAV